MSSSRSERISKCHKSWFALCAQHKPSALNHYRVAWPSLIDIRWFDLAGILWPAIVARRMSTSCSSTSTLELLLLWAHRLPHGARTNYRERKTRFSKEVNKWSYRGENHNKSMGHLEDQRSVDGCFERPEWTRRPLATIFVVSEPNDISSDLGGGNIHSGENLSQEKQRWNEWVEIQQIPVTLEWRETRAVTLEARSMTFCNRLKSQKTAQKLMRTTFSENSQNCTRRRER